MRLALLMACSVLGLGLVNQYYFETRYVDQLETELEWRGLSLSRYIASESGELVLVEDMVGLQRLLDTAKTTAPDFAYAFFLDRTDRVLAHTFASGFPEGLRLVNRANLKHDHRVERIEVFDEIFRDFAVSVGGGRIGTLRLGVRDQRIRDQVKAARQELFLLMLVAMLISSLIAYLFTWFGLRPLGTIVKNLQRFSPGKHREALSLGRNDEVGDLASKIDEITARLHETQRHLTRAEKMASIGVMAAGVAHEINNPITGIQNCLRRIQAHPGDGEQLKEYVDVMLKGTEHIEVVVRGLLDFSRAGAQQITRLNWTLAIQRAIDLAALRMEKRRIQIQFDAPKRPVWVLGDFAQLTQVVINLLLNSADAMPSGGAVIVILEEQPGSAVLTVKDNGVGISPVDLPHVFDPFFTTKEAGKGTGLGLAVSHGIVADHHGRIDIDSSPLQGTTVVVWLPLIGEDQNGNHSAA